MKKKYFTLILLLVVATVAIGIISYITPEKSDDVSLTPKETTEKEEPKATYQKISAEEAKTMMDQNHSAIVLDVRSQDEYNSGHIKDALLVPVDTLEKEAATKLPDKEATILIYCRSGNRSKTAANQLIKMGYSKVYDFGGIGDWPYEIIK